MADAIPVSAAAKRAARAGGSARPPLIAALTDGDDFELLFTVTGRDAVPLLDAWKKEFPNLPLACVGKIVEGQGVSLRDQRGTRPLTESGYEHFR